MSDRPRYVKTLKRLMRRDAAVLHQMKKMTNKGLGTDLKRAFRVDQVYTTRVSREHRVFLVPEQNDFRLLGFASRGDNRYFNHEA